MILSAADLDSFQKCPRRWKIQQSEESRWNPKALFDATFRQAVFALSNGGDKAKVTSNAITTFLEKCAKPGLDTSHDPYTLAHDWVAVLQTSIEAISRTVLLTLKPGITVPLSAKTELNGTTRNYAELAWRCSSFEDDSGMLHRWASVSKIDADSITRELHSWAVFGDCSAVGAPMTLHLIEVGQQRNGHQHTHWCRSWRHPAIAGRFAFQQKDGTALKGEWKPVWFQDSKNEPRVWVDLMQRDNVNLIRHLQVKQPTNEQAATLFREQVILEAERMRSAPEWQQIPMTRTACDFPQVCAWQALCYR